MARPLRRSAMIALGLYAAAVAHGQPVVPFRYDLPPGFPAHTESLPTGQDICLRLGLDPQVPGRCNVMAALAMSARQTDHALWFFKSTMGLANPIYCPGAIAFDRYKASGDVEYLCRAPEKDVTITPGELDALQTEVTRLDAVSNKTLAEHIRASELKAEIDCATGRRVEDCD